MPKSQTEFKERYVLGVGYPWALGINIYKTMALCLERTGTNYKILDWPKELWRHDLPKYRLVLEKL